MTPGSCGYCGCTEDAPCPGGCAWTDTTRTLCTACLELETFASLGIRVLHDTAQQALPKILLVTAVWAELTFAQRQLLVRAMVSLRERLATMAFDELMDDAAAALVTVATVREYLTKHVPVQEIGAEESTADLIIRLLDPQIGHRIIVPGGRA